MRELRCTVETSQGCTIVKLEGFLDAHTASDLEKRLEELAQSGLYRVILDFADLEYISSAGLGVLMGAINTFREHEGDLKLVSLPPKIFKVFDLLGFTRLFAIYPDISTALEAFDTESSH